MVGNVPARLHARDPTLTDGENVPLRMDVLYGIRHNDWVASIEAIRRRHGADIYLLPVSGGSAGGGIFRQAAPDEGTVVGLKIDPTTAPRIRFAQAVDITLLALDEIVIDRRDARVYAGAAITLDQLNSVLKESVGESVRVLGADLTSYTYAQVGATFMTGGMGPQRRYFSDSVTEIALYDGEKVIRVTGQDVHNYAACYGWCGIVSAVRCAYVTLPSFEYAFALPVGNTPESLARLLAHFAPHAYFEADQYKNSTSSRKTSLILGLEHITVRSMEPLFAQGVENKVVRRARMLAEHCHAAGVDGLVFVNGQSDLSVDRFLLELVDDIKAERPTIAGMDLEHADVFSDPEAMRAVREAIPFAARTRVPQGRFVYKSHTDANVRLNPDGIETAMRRLWHANEQYVASVETYFASTPDLEGEVLVYGHVNPFGVDPHNRITMATNRETVYHAACAHVQAQRARFLLRLQQVCVQTDSTFIGGEKGAGSEAEMLMIFKEAGPDCVPAELADKFDRQREIIRHAPRLFNWRALSPYVEP